MRTLVVVPHMDDESLSCGGLILKRAREGHEVKVLTLMGRKYDYGQGDQYEQEQQADFECAMAILGVQWWEHCLFEEGEPYKHGYYELLKAVEDRMRMFKPDEIVVPSPHDLNQDHRHVADVCRIACRPANLGSIHRVLRWHGNDGCLPDATWFVPLTHEELDRKITAVKCYERELRDGAHPRSITNLVARSRVHGSQAGVEFAEGYTLLLER